MGFSIESVGVDLPRIGMQRLDFSSRAGASSKITIMIGENGCGKSTFLRELHYWARQDQERSRRVSERERRIIRDVWLGDNLNGTGRSLPSRLIALSFTPFDKFPPRDDLSNGSTAEDAFYIYMGFKNQYGSSGSRSKLLRIIEQIQFQKHEKKFNAGIANVLNLIGYLPALQVRYRLTHRFKRIANEVSKRDERRQSTLPLPDISEKTEHDEDDRRKVQKYLDVSEVRAWLSKPAYIQVDFADQWASEVDGISDDGKLSADLIQNLVADGFMFVDAVRLQSNSNRDSWIDMFELSSGELNLIVAFLGLGIHLRDGSLVLIDEPENSLHPAWQEKYAGLLETAFSGVTGCHFVIATHSPIILSGVAKSVTSVVRLDRLPCNLNGSDFDGVSPDASLIGGFGVVTEGNSYLRQLALEALTLIRKGEGRGQRFYFIQGLFERIFLEIPAADPIKKLAAAIIEHK